TVGDRSWPESHMLFPRRIDALACIKFRFLSSPQLAQSEEALDKLLNRSPEVETLARNFGFTPDCLRAAKGISWHKCQLASRCNRWSPRPRRREVYSTLLDR